VSNPAKAADLCIPWSIRVMDEFFMHVRSPSPGARAAAARAAS
jgi:hypothetical protein